MFIDFFREGKGEIGKEKREREREKKRERERGGGRREREGERERKKERERERERQGKRNIHQLPPARTATGSRTSNLGVCPDLDLKPRPSDVRGTLQQLSHLACAGSSFDFVDSFLCFPKTL